MDALIDFLGVLLALHRARIPWWDWRRLRGAWRSARLLRALLGKKVVIDGQERTIVAYGEGTRTVTVAPEWSRQPGAGDEFRLP